MNNWTIEKDGGGVILSVVRSCGHVERLGYANKHFAEIHAEAASKGECCGCRCSAFLKPISKETSKS